jgi:hypothetical protein
MKIVIGILLLGLAVNASAKMSGGEKFAFRGDLQYSGFCKAIVSDNLSLLKRTMSRKVGELGASRKDVLRKLVSQDGMTCNGVNLIKFSQLRDATEVYAYLTKKN